jgi:hypothetical protein
VSLGLRVKIWLHCFVTSALYRWVVHVPTVFLAEDDCWYQLFSTLDGPREKALSSPDTMTMQVVRTHFLQNIGQQYEYHTHTHTYEEYSLVHAIIITPYVTPCISKLCTGCGR